MDPIQMQDSGILKDIFTECKCHTANLSLLNIRSYINTGNSSEISIKLLYPSHFSNTVIT